MSKVTKLHGYDYVKAFYGLCLRNKHMFRKVSKGAIFTDTRYKDLESIDTSSFAWLAARRSDKPITATTAERILRHLRATDRCKRVNYLRNLRKSKFKVVNG